MIEDFVGFWDNMTVKAASPPAGLVRTGEAGESTTGYVDAWRSEREPTATELIDAYKNVAYACATINANAVASVPYHLYVQTNTGQPQVKIPCHRVSRKQGQWLMANKGLAPRVNKAVEIAEVEDHPLLDLLLDVNEWLEGFTLFQLTSLYQDMVGRAYWYLPLDNMLGVPDVIWILPSQYVRPIRDAKKVIARYEYVAGRERESFETERVIPFLRPNLYEPYSDGWGSMRAAYEANLVHSRNLAFQQASLRNRARPDALVSPKTAMDALGEPERERFERRLNRKFREGGAGGIMMLGEPLDFMPLNFTSREMELAAMYGVTKVDIANAFGVPMSLLETRDVNRANAEAGHYQHAKLAVLPRIRAIEDRLNQKLCPMFDKRLFLAFDNPVPEDKLTMSTVWIGNVQNKIASPEQAAEAQGIEYDTEYFEGEKQREDERVERLAEQMESQNAEQEEEEPESEEMNMDSEMKRFEILCGHFLKDASHKDCVSGLMATGLPIQKALAWTDPVQIGDVQGACEHCGQVHVPVVVKGRIQRQWYTEPPQGRDLELILKAVFRVQERAILRKVKSVLVNIIRKGPIDWEGLSKDPLSWNEDMAARAFPIYQKRIMEGMGDTARRLDMLGNEDVMRSLSLSNPRVPEAIQRASFRFADSTNRTTSMELLEALTKLKADLAGGMIGPDNTIPALTKTVHAVFDRAEEYRAARIAITESSRAVHMGQRMSAEASGIVKGFEWVLSPDACPECQEIGAKFPNGIGLNESFRGGNFEDYSRVDYPPLHPNCCAGETPVIAPGTVGAFTARYEGPCIRIKTIRGTTTVSPNHLFLTPKGFISAELLKKGDEVFNSSGVYGEIFGCPDYEWNPTPIEQIVRSLSKAPCMSARSVPVSAEDFHGDAGRFYGNINVITANCLLLDGDYSALVKRLRQAGLARTDPEAALLAGQSALLSSLFALCAASDGGMGIRRVAPMFIRRQLGVADKLGLRAGADTNTRLPKAQLNRTAATSQTFGDRQLRLSGLITTDHILKVETIHYSGLLYDLETLPSLYLCNGLVSSNCMCALNEIIDETALTLEE